jgi:protein-disulfide isomerase
MTGKVRYVTKNYIVHSGAEIAAEAAECAGEQGMYWYMNDLLFTQQSEWSGQATSATLFKQYAGKLGLNQAQFDACLDSNKYADKLAADQKDGQAAKVSGTPTFVINGAPLVGAQPYSAFQQQIEYYLAGGQTPTLIVAADSFRSKGKADAPMVITEFSDFQ